MAHGHPPYNEGMIAIIMLLGHGGAGQHLGKAIRPLSNLAPLWKSRKTTPESVVTNVAPAVTDLT